MDCVYQQNEQHRWVHVPTCANCGKTTIGWLDFSSAVANAYDEGWTHLDGKTLCPVCKHLAMHVISEST